MDLYLAGADKFGQKEKEQALQLNKDAKIPSNVLFSYHYLQSRRPQDLAIYHNVGCKLFIDSGAFSVWTKNSSVNVDDYIRWINDCDNYIDLLGQVDVIPGILRQIPTQQEIIEAANNTWNNYIYMRSRLNSPDKLLYTFHIGEPKYFLEQALEWKDSNGQFIKYIGLGGMVGQTEQSRRNFMSLCFDIIRKSSNPNVKIHTFGMTSKDLLSQFPVTSADSTSWVMTAAMGSIMTDAGIITVSKNKQNNPGHVLNMSKENLKYFEDTYIKKFGFTLDELISSRVHRETFNAMYMKDRFSKIIYKPLTRKKLF